MLQDAVPGRVDGSGFPQRENVLDRMGSERCCDGSLVFFSAASQNHRGHGVIEEEPELRGSRRERGRNDDGTHLPRAQCGNYEVRPVGPPQQDPFAGPHAQADKSRRNLVAPDAEIREGQAVPGLVMHDPRAVAKSSRDKCIAELHADVGVVGQADPWNGKIVRLKVCWHQPFSGKCLEDRVDVLHVQPPSAVAAALISLTAGASQGRTEPRVAAAQLSDPARARIAETWPA